MTESVERSYLTEWQAAVNSRVARADVYLHNAELAASKRELTKSSELLWGAVTQYVKALAAAEGREIWSHKGFQLFLSEMARTRRQPRLLHDFVRLQLLHRNFYDEEIPVQDFTSWWEDGLSFLELLRRNLDSTVRSVLRSRSRSQRRSHR